jgi:hypothetical protein
MRILCVAHLQSSTPVQFISPAARDYRINFSINNWEKPPAILQTLDISCRENKELHEKILVTIKKKLFL